MASQGEANMTIATFLSVATVLPCDTSILLRGDHGIGKSQLVREVARLRADKETGDGIERPVVDRRLAQMTEGDMLGLPSTDGERTRFNPPDWYVECCESPRVLLLDELNRANTEIMQAAFQIVLDRELAGRKLHPQTLVFAAINTAANYTVNEVDPALLDRFFTVDLTPDSDDWIAWSQKKNLKTNRPNIDPVITDFIRDNVKWLDTPKDVDPQAVTTSRRSWERVSNALVDTNLVENPDNPLFFAIAMGYVGREAAIALRKFAKEYDRSISAEDVIERYTTKKVQAKLRGSDGSREPTQDDWNSLIEKVGDYVVGKLDNLSDKQGKNLQQFMTDLPEELRLSFWTRLTKKGIDKAPLARAVHKWCGKLVLGIFGVEPGEAGIGTPPQIPGLLKNKSR